jgi:GT2 family glycosyltransferase
VNNNCTDGTDAVIGAFADRLPIRRLVEPVPGLSHARNCALQHASGDYILWIDDDVLVDPQWLNALVESVRRHPQAVAFGGPIEPWFPIAPDPTLGAAFPWLERGFCGIDHGSTECLLQPDRPIYGANMAFATSAVGRLRFDVALGTVQGSGAAGEEIDFVNRLRRQGGAVVWCPTMRVRHYVDPERMTLGYLRRFYYGRGQTLVRQSGGDDAPRLFGVPRWIWPQLVRSWAKFTVLRATPFRVPALISLREYCQLRGMVNESRTRYHEEKLARRSALQTKDDDVAA